MAQLVRMFGGERREHTPSCRVSEVEHASSSWVQKSAAGGQAKLQSSWWYFRKQKQGLRQKTSGKSAQGAVASMAKSVELHSGEGFRHISSGAKDFSGGRQQSSSGTRGSP